MTGILFDLDGTLLDTLDDLTDATNHTLAQLGYPLRSREEMRRFVGNGAARQLQQSVPEGEPWEQALELYLPYYRTHCRIKTAPYPGIPEALAALREQYPVAIVSNKPDGATKALCAEFFPGICAMGQSDGCPRKPAPDMVFRAMQEIGADTCIYVGDSEVDILTAQNADVPCISVLWGFRDRKELAAAGGLHFCEEPSRLTETVNALIAKTQR